MSLRATGRPTSRASSYASSAVRNQLTIISAKPGTEAVDVAGGSGRELGGVRDHGVREHEREQHERARGPERVRARAHERAVTVERRGRHAAQRLDEPEGERERREQRERDGEHGPRRALGGDGGHCGAHGVAAGGDGR